MYEITLTDKAKKQLEKLDKHIQERIVAALERIRIRPQDYVVRLVGDLGYKLRVGDYRVIMDINNKQMTILIIKVGHRRNVYNL